ncbi:hypothetical protein GCM10007301_47990 [Azorhizobium oxalatiphilum]|uniref:Uncharacterized protein n=1 Tax=Azorhizobium oxalatiphilum TaxID=980631 RepID=A0A917CAS6_9HYPH|nr:hypothetical protein [Azorhizobium oxalatiphilum]GGF82291.1 hypothetical protein GCM10007301_47990 [Azorhizobium oxalatiphilum]
MGRRAARFTEADLTRVLKAAKKAGLQARVDLIHCTVELGENIVSTALDHASDAEAARLQRVKGLVL